MNTPDTEALTHAETAVLRLVDAGLSNMEIAGNLSISVSTVKCHLHRAFEKLGARNRMHAVARARTLELFSPRRESSARLLADRTLDC